MSDLAISQLPAATTIASGDLFAIVNSSTTKKITATNVFGTVPVSVLFATDNANDIGASGATRPRTIYAGTSIFSALIVGGTATTSDLTLQTTSGVGATGADMHFLVGNNGATEAMTILNSGNVGIGTPGPTSRLHIVGSGTSGDLRIGSASDPDQSYNTVLTSKYSAGNPFTLTTYYGAELLAMYGGDTYLGAFSKSGAIVIQNTTGNVGIGTTSFGTNAVTVLGIASGTAPTTGPADTVQLYSSDDAAGHTIPSFFCEGTNVLATGQADSASSVRVKMRINGTVVTLLAI